MKQTRKVGNEIVERMRAKSLMKPYLESIRPLVDRAIFLETIASVGRSRPEHRGEARSLVEHARQSLCEIDRAITEEAALSFNNRVYDARRALLSVIDRCERTYTAL